MLKCEVEIKKTVRIYGSERLLGFGVAMRQVGFQLGLYEEHPLDTWRGATTLQTRGA